MTTSPDKADEPGRDPAAGAGQVSVSTGCRLHFGLLGWGAGAGPRFGGAGVILEAPGVELLFTRTNAWSVTGAEPGRTRVDQFLATYRRRRADHAPPSCRIEVRREIPPHAGLGSGTQLALAVARGLSALGGEPGVPAVELARYVGRGRRSAIGIHGFEHGGFIVDGGQHEPGAIGRLVERLPFPEAWRFVLVTPTGSAGLSGRTEVRAFEQLPAMSDATASDLRRLVIDELRPSIAAADFERCAAAIVEFNVRVGAAFAPAQGGVFANPKMGKLAAELCTGVAGVGQTSWGPTLFALVASAEAAAELCAWIGSKERWSGCTVAVTAARNRPAEVTSVPPESRAGGA